MKKTFLLTHFGVFFYFFQQNVLESNKFSFFYQMIFLLYLSNVLFTRTMSDPYKPILDTTLTNSTAADVLTGKRENSHICLNSKCFQGFYIYVYIHLLFLVQIIFKYNVEVRYIIYNICTYILLFKGVSPVFLVITFISVTSCVFPSCKYILMIFFQGGGGWRW